MEVVEKQLREDSPPQTRETLERLTGQGFSNEDARHLIGSAIAAEMRDVVSQGRPFSKERFLSLMSNLPLLPTP